jgi:hypothetical protein
MMYNLLRHQDNAHARRWEEERATSARRAVAAASAAPAPAKATVVAVRAPGTKKSPPPLLSPSAPISPAPLPYKRQKKAAEPAAAPTPAAAPAPAPFVGVDGAVACAPAEKKSPPVLPPAPAAASVTFLLDKPIHPSGILIKIVGTAVSCQGRLCKEHKICSQVLKEDVVVRLRKMQLMVEGKEETAIAAIWATNGIDCCRVGFVPHPMVKHAAGYDGALAQVTRVLSDNAETCETVEQHLFHRNKGFCLAMIISTLPGSTK